MTEEKTIVKTNLVKKFLNLLGNFPNLGRQSVIISGAVATLLVFGVQKLQVLENIELQVYDRMMQLHPDESPDQRLVIVGITEEDLQKWGWPLSGEILNRLLGTLEESQARGIGLDMFRDIPQEPGHAALLQRLESSDIIIPVCKHANKQIPGIPLPSGVEHERAAFSDVVEDIDSSIRRNLISVSTDSAEVCRSAFSLGWQLALKYLEVDGISAELTSEQKLKLGDVTFTPLSPHSGGYERADTAGYQILLNYRSPQVTSQQVTLTEVLEGKIKPDLFTDRIVIVGSVAPSLKDIFNTPFTSGRSDNSGKMPGVEVHAQMVSQILSAVLDDRPLFMFLPEWGEIVLIGTLSVMGGLLAKRIRHPLGLAVGTATSLVVLFGGSFILFTQAVWLPVVSPALALVVGILGTLTFTAYDTKREEEKIRQQAEEQASLIAQLQKLSRQEIAGPKIMGQQLSVDTVLKQRYRITKIFPGGGFGKTYLAQDNQLPGNPLCIVKQMRPTQNDPEYLRLVQRLFNTEAEILAVLGKHPYIPQLLAFFSEAQNWYLVQEFIDGHSLTDELMAEVRHSRREVIKMLQEVLETLVFVHGYKVIHRDIKPGNLMRRTADNRIFLIDFGGVKQLPLGGQDGQQRTIAFGTPGYAPPEQMAGTPTLNSDIYALGIIAIQALTGVYPKDFRRDVQSSLIQVRQELNNGELDLQHWWNIGGIDTNEELTQVVNKMVDTNFTQRYQSASDVLDALRKIQ